MSKKKTLADLMDNDFFIDFDNTEVKVERKRLAESMSLKESKDIDRSALNRCYRRICKSAAEDKSFTWDSNDYIPTIGVKISKEHLKKALKLGNFERRVKECRTIPAQYVDSVGLEYFDNFIDAEFRDEDEDCFLSVVLLGEHEKTGHDIMDFVGLGGGDGTVCTKELPAFKTPEESMNFFNKEVIPNATKIAEEMIDKAWAESGCKDYEGITNDGSGARLRMLGLNVLDEGFYDYDLSKDKISKEDLYKALVTDGELVTLNVGNTGETVDFKDGSVYSDTAYEITEYNGVFSVVEFFNSDDGDWKEGSYTFETDSFETLCAELQKIFPNALIECMITEEVNREEHDLAFYVSDAISHLVNDLGMDSSEEGFADKVIKDIEDNYDVDVPTDMKAYTNWCSEVMCEVSRQLNITEDFKEPDNAVVDCKVNKVIAHCEDEKPVDCLGKKKPLEKPLTEEQGD